MSLDAALQYAGRGWCVFPISRSKKPLVKWGTEATTDPIKIADMWRKRPGAYVAMALGEIIVLDADGPGGLAKLLEMAAACGGQIPDTLRASTPRAQGGLHVFYRVPSGTVVRLFTAPRANKGDDGLDIKGRGSLVVLPEGDGSDGRQWLNQTPIATLTPAMLAWIVSYTGKRGEMSAGSGPLTGGTGRNAGDPLPAYVTDVRSARAIAGESLAQRALSSQGRTPWSTYEEARIRSALAAIDIKGMRYDTFVQIGMALEELAWDRSDGTSIGFDLWDEFCARSEYYDQAGLEQKWTSFGNYGGNRVGVGSIIAWAKEAGWTGVVTQAQLGVTESVVGSFPNGGKDGTYVNGTNGVAYALPAQLAAPTAPIFVDFTDKGQLRSTVANTRCAMRMLGLTCAHDRFHEKLIIGGRVIEQWSGEVADNAIHVLKGMIRQKFGFEPSKDAMHDAVVQECLANSFHPIRDYIDGLVWDGVPRLDAWLRTYMGADDAPLTRAIGRLSLIAAVRRIEEPGCKFDQIIVLEGPQGKGKSTAIEILAGSDNYSDQTILTLDDRAQQEAVQGTWLFEIGELAGITRADIERVNAFASRKRDRARPAYGRVREDRPRQCVFFGTTNDPQYLRRQTGNRRFWPVVTGTIDLAGLERDRDQLWAEAADVEATGVSLILSSQLWGDALSAQDARMVHDPWLDMLSGAQSRETYEVPDGTGRREWRLPTTELLSGRLGLATDRLTDATSKRLSYVMKQLGWNGPDKKWIDGKAVRAYTKKVEGAAEQEGNK